MLQIKDITKDYPVGTDMTVHALKGVSLNFRKSEFVSVLGASGCGKTTLLNIIGGLDRYTSGDLVINGVSTKDYKDADWDAYRNYSIGFVFQSYNLIPHMSILDNVTLSLTLSGASKAERIRKAQAALAKVGLADHMRKRPNQLSGGQMQRVAIARAIVNDPDIILADEPTGALDSETGVQIMDLLEEIAKDRLVIMVTHNKELAEAYSTRIVRLHDGEVVADSNPFDDEEYQRLLAERQTTAESDNNNVLTAESGTPNAKKHVKGNKRVGMSPLTAFMLSFRNLLSKKGRTLLTAIAGSIGIFGVTLVLAISAGMTAYVDNVQKEAMGDTPIVIAEQTIDVDALMSGDAYANNITPYPTGTTGILPYENAMLTTIRNNLSAEYIVYVKKLNPDWCKAIDYGYALAINAFYGTDGSYKELSSFSTATSEIVSSDEMFRSNYDVVAKADSSTDGFPTNANEVVFVVDKYNRVDTTKLRALGIDVSRTADGYSEIPYAEILGREFKLLGNNDYYEYNSARDRYETRAQADIDATCASDKAITLRIVGVVRRKSDSSANLLQSGIAYTAELAQTLIADSVASDVAVAQRNSTGRDVLTGKPINATSQNTAEQEWLTRLKRLGGYELPTTINIYPADGSAKDNITEYLNKWNATQVDPDNKVTYVDIQGVAISMMSTMIDVTTGVLIAFSAVSLVVSTVMIAVTTYTSVVERTKEIGVLRSLGASKSNISGIFNAETSIIGAFAGAIGIIFAVVAGVIVNAVLYNLFDVANIVLFTVPIVLGMLALSILLTLVAGLIPAAMAAHRDPVTCLRSE